ncbi:addiction module protein [Stratiformator vulcanicus]|uniref:Addiction module component n=1 Tax=Stratiformator vulcanicus TaxID=2527980 RepID=A0A517R4P5_9PLAN|nr:addiction module protein [Stratiformator vulcanicus]QDT38859.1 Putative addiction module component [Stratiformator vulcanicus]
MSSKTEQLISEALELPDAERLQIASSLMLSVGPDLSDVRDTDWVAELNRRSDEFSADPSIGIAWETLKNECDE